MNSIIERHTYNTISSKPEVRSYCVVFYGHLQNTRAVAKGTRPVISFSKAETYCGLPQVF